MIDRKRLGNGFVRYSFRDGSHYDVAEVRFSETELKLIDGIEQVPFHEEGAAASFVAKYGGQRYGGKG